MKTNLPVTQHEIPFPYGHMLVSRTDLKGVLTDANEGFVRLSGFSREDLIGKSHNMVRHPDMPEQAFSDLWGTVKRGKPWRGIVKNRAKNGDFYWVDAFVVPVRKAGEVVGYMSVRTEPTREQINEAATLYATLKKNSHAMPAGNKFAHLWNVKTRLAATMSVSVLMVIITVLIGLSGLRSGNQMLETVYSNYADPVFEIKTSMQLMDGAFKHVSLGLAHSPDSRSLKLHDHALTKHTEKISGKISELNQITEKLDKQLVEADEKQLLADFKKAESDYIEQGLRPAYERLNAGDFDGVAVILSTKITPLYEVASASAKELELHFEKQGGEIKRHAEDNYDATLKFNLICVLVSLLIMLVASQLQARAILRPIREVIRSFNRIEEGILTDEYDLSRQDEFGELNGALAVMQTRLKAMLDEIHEASMSLQQHSANLDAQMYMVVKQSEAQSDRIQAAAAGAEQSSQSVAEVADLAAHMNESANTSNALVTQSNQALMQSMAANQKVADAVQISGKVIVDLSQRIDNINSITVSIKKIADQTNLLALNAAIEAARAGESGRGFAVVADEVHKLAERTAKSTLDITAMVAEIRGVASDAVREMELATGEVQAGVMQMNSSAEGLAHVAEAGKLVVSSSQHIAEFAREQQVTSQMMANGMEQIAELVAQNTLLAKDASRLSDDLHQTSDVMRRVIDTFELQKNGHKSQAKVSSSTGDIDLF
jgi:aerotaxis receptor